jgi:hypothetical protein
MNVNTYTQDDSKLLSVFLFIRYWNPDNNLDYLCISNGQKVMASPLVFPTEV